MIVPFSHSNGTWHDGTQQSLNICRERGAWVA